MGACFLFGFSVSKQKNFSKKIWSLTCGHKSIPTTICPKLLLAGCCRDTRHTLTKKQKQRYEERNLMIVIMEAGIAAEDARVQAVVDKAKSLGLNPSVTGVVGTEYGVTQVFLKDGKTVRSASLSEHFFQILDGVGSVQRVTPPSVSLAYHKGNGSYHRIKLGDNSSIMTRCPCLLVAGPCTVDSKIDAVVERLAALGIKRIRGGCWKPRSKPEAFPGFGQKGVRWLLEAALKHKIDTVFLEVIESSHIEIVRKVRNDVGYKGTIVLWVGARTSNPILLLALGAQAEFPVMIKNGLDDQRIDDISARAEWVLGRQSVWNEDGTLDEAASLKPGNNQVIICLRGTRQTDPRSLYRFIPNHHWTRIIHREWWSPVCIDPSHSAGEENLVLENIQDALRFNPSLIMVEGGYEDGGYRGLCDMAQSVSISSMRRVIEMVSDHNEKMYGKRIF